MSSTIIAVIVVAVVALAYVAYVKFVNKKDASTPSVFVGTPTGEPDSTNPLPPDNKPGAPTP